MNDNTDLNTEAFENSVMAAITALTEYEKDKHGSTKILEQFLSVREIGYGGGTEKNIHSAIDENSKIAKRVLEEKEVRQRICAALQNASNDAFEIAKIIIPILIGLNIAQTTQIPMVSLLFASISLFIARMGVASLCIDIKKDT